MYRIEKLCTDVRVCSAYLLTAGPPDLVYLLILTLNLFRVGLPLPLHLHLKPQLRLST